MTTRPTPPYGLKTDVRGAVRFSGERHGRRVDVTLSGGASEVRVAADVPSFEARSRDGKVRPKRGEGLPPGIAEALASVPASTEWKNLTVRGDADGILVRRKPAAEAGWLADLWLAERVAAAT